jgi:hypothetical protein
VQSLPECPALVVYTGLVETRQRSWLDAPERWGYLTAPVSVYRGGELPRSTSLLLPFEMGLDDQEYVARAFASRVDSKGELALIVRGEFSGPSWTVWLTARLTAAGYRKERQFSFRRVQVLIFRPTG